MSASKYPRLFEPGRIGRLKLKNRFIQSPLHTKFSTDLGEVSQKLIDYHVERARGGVSMIILENTAVDWERGRAAGNPVRIDDDVYITGLSDLTEAVHREGVLIATQLHHAGRQNGVANTDGRGPVAPSPIASTAIGDVPHELTLDEIDAIVDEFRQAARRSKMAGFDMVELHGSHGYLLTQFLSPQSNVRTDAYGGSFENRARFGLRVTQAVRDEVGPDFPVSYRISVEERTAGGMSADEGIAFCKLIAPYVDVFNVTAATYESMDSIFMMQGRRPAELLPLAVRVKEQTGKPVIGISRLGWALEESEDAVASGHLDFVAMARTQLADPNLVIKTKRGEEDRVRRCIACNECVGGFLFNGWRVHCVMNPELGYEREAAARLAERPARKKVVVIGGGPAGCEAARAAALRGHDVRLYEQAAQLGGLVRIGARAPYKRKEMEAYVRYFERELDHVGVDVRLGRRLEVGDPELAGADVVLLATGGQPLAQTPDGAVDAVDFIAGEFSGSGICAVLGAGEHALNAAAVAADRGYRTIVVTAGQEAGHDMNPILAAHTVSLLAGIGVEFADVHPGAAELTVSAPGWGPTEGVVSHSEAVDVREIGSRLQGGRLFEATQSGFWTGTRV